MNGSRERCAGAQLCRVFQAVKRESGFDLKYNVWASQVELVIKNLPANARDTKDTGSIPELGRSPGVRNGNPLLPENILAWKIPWTEECGGL